MKQKINKIHEIPDSLENLFDTQPFRIVFSILCAVLIWFAVSVTAYKTTHVTFYNIPLSVELTGTLADANGLSAVSCDVEKVTVQLEGNRSQIGRLTPEDLTAYLQPGSITAAGEFNLEIAVRSDTDISFTAASIIPSHATVKLDKIETRSFDVTASFPYIHVTEGHALDENDIVCEPSVVEVTGPSAQLDEIDRVEVYSDKNVAIDSLYTLYASDLKFYTEEGALMNADNLETPGTDFQITISVLTQKELELTYDIRNTFSGFDLNWLRSRLHLSQDSITLASKTNTVFADRDSYNIGFVTLDSITMNFSADFDFDFKEEFINQSGFQQVTLSLDNEGLATREIWVTKDNIFIINAPKDYDCRVTTLQMPITVIGDEEELENLSVQDIIVTVDLMNYNVQQGTTGSSDAAISFTSKDSSSLVRLWAAGNYRVVMEFEKMQTETVSETNSYYFSPETDPDETDD